MDLPWMTDVIKSKLKGQFNLTKTCYKYGKRKFDLEKLIVKTSEWMENISAAKDKYIQQKCEKLKEPLTPKTYWKVINRFLSNKIPLLLVNGEIIPNFSQKYLCSKFFAFQCTPLQISSSLPTFCLRTEEILLLFNVSKNKIFAIIKNLNSNKSHG